MKKMDIAITLRKQHFVFKKRKETLVTQEHVSYEQLIAPIETQMMRSIWRIVRDPQEAEDTMQEALTITWRRLDRIRSHPNPQALILKICIDASYDTLRKRKRYDRTQQEDPEQLHNVPSPAGLTAPDELEGKEIENEILNAIGRLPRKQAVAVLMRIVQEQSYETIAQALGCAETTVRIHVSRGRERLSRLLSHYRVAAPRSERGSVPRSKRGAAPRPEVSG
ncbi:MAG: RNA polymerase sigma factor [bacterium]|nr:RNA polymerase sigma factor [bacterium]